MLLYGMEVLGSERVRELGRFGRLLLHLTHR